MKLYEITGVFAELFDSFESICNYNLEKNEDGQFIDDDGNIIPDPDAYRADMQQAWFDTLSGIEDDFEEKAENIAAYIKNLQAQSDELKKEEDALYARRKVKENQIGRMKKYLLESMKKIKRLKIDTPRAKLSIRDNAESAKIYDEKAFVNMCMEKGLEKYLRFKAPEINKMAVKKDLQSNIKIIGAELERTQSLIIK